MHLKVEKYLLHDDLQLYLGLYTGGHVFLAWPHGLCSDDPLRLWRGFCGGGCVCVPSGGRHPRVQTPERKIIRKYVSLSLYTCVSVRYRAVKPFIFYSAVWCTWKEVLRGLRSFYICQLYKGTLCYQHSFYSVLPATARSHLTAFILDRCL